MEVKSTLNQLRRQERENRKQLIIHASIKLFANHPLSNVSMRDIAKEAGISPASIYRYFEDKDDLFVEAFMLKSRELIEHFKKNPIETDISIEKFASDFVTFMLDNDLFFKMMTYFMMDNGIKDDSMSKFNDCVRELLKIFDHLFHNLGIKENVRVYSHAFFSSLNGVMITFRNYPGRSEKEIRNHIQRLAALIGGLFCNENKKSPVKGM